MLGDQPVYDLAVSGRRAEGRFLVGFHETAVAGDIGSEVLEAYARVIVKAVGKQQATKQLDKLIDDNLEGEEGLPDNDFLDDDFEVI